MSGPMVACVMLTADRPSMARRAIRSFLAQTYERKRLYIWDTSTVRLDVYGMLGVNEEFLVSAPPVARERLIGATIGRLRNAANKYALAHYTTLGTQPEVFIHWDDDDYSHPCRVEEQVELLLSHSIGIPSMGKIGAECVGYNDVLFWDSRIVDRVERGPNNEAWRYRSLDPRYVIGSSMCYWADAWRADPFDDAPGEDLRWWRKHSARCVGVSSQPPNFGARGAPRLICSIHGGNTDGAYGLDENGASYMRPPMWTREDRYDEYVRGKMAL